jgi:hypothetical protein
MFVLVNWLVALPSPTFGYGAPAPGISFAPPPPPAAVAQEGVMRTLVDTQGEEHLWPLDWLEATARDGELASANTGFVAMASEAQTDRMRVLQRTWLRDVLRRNAQWWCERQASKPKELRLSRFRLAWPFYNWPCTKHKCLKHHLTSRV